MENSNSLHWEQKEELGLKENKRRIHLPIKTKIASWIVIIFGVILMLFGLATISWMADPWEAIMISSNKIGTKRRRFFHFETNWYGDRFS